jgi:hypothetical protein
VTPTGQIVRRYVLPNGQAVTPGGHLRQYATAPSRSIVQRTAIGADTCDCGSTRPTQVVMQPGVAQHVVSQPVISQPGHCDCATLRRICPNCGGEREY